MVRIFPHNIYVRDFYPEYTKHFFNSIVKSSKGKATSNIYETPRGMSANFSAEIRWTRRKQHDIFKMMRGKNQNQEHSIQQGYHSDLKESERVLFFKFLFIYLFLLLK